MVFQCKQAKQTNRTVILNQQVHITGCSGSITGNRSKKCQRLYPKLVGKIGTLIRKNGDPLYLYGNVPKGDLSDWILGENLRDDASG